MSLPVIDCHVVEASGQRVVLEFEQDYLARYVEHWTRARGLIRAEVFETKLTVTGPDLKIDGDKLILGPGAIVITASGRSQVHVTNTPRMTPHQQLLASAALAEAKNTKPAKKKKDAKK